MCGIAGVIHRGQIKNTGSLTAHFLSGLRHRGPDYEWSLQGDNYLLMHTRLSIIDLTPAAHQPFESNDGNYIIVFNGEIYNYRDIRKKLEGQGCVFKTHSDTEVLIQGFITWKEKVLDELDGMFAFAIFDKSTGKLFAARDRVGKKPLFYCLTNDIFCFASESDVIADSGLIAKRLSLPGVNSFLAIGYILSPGSLYENIFQLNPGEYLWMDGKDFNLRTKPYWDILNSYQSKIAITENEATEQISLLLKQAVRKRLTADVEIGVFLSGGIDSSIVAAIAAEGHPNIKAFTAGFADAAFDENKYAAILSKHISAEHYTYNMPSVNTGALIQTIDETDGVLADTSILAMNPLAKFTRQYVKAVLSGDGADELFGGYATYRAFHYKSKLSFMPPVAWNALRKLGKVLPAQSSSKVSLNYKWDKFFSSGTMDDVEAHYHYREHHSVQERIAIMGAECKELIMDNDPLIKFRKYGVQAKGLNVFEQLLYIDFKTWLPDDILVKTDRSSMQWGLEVRSPFLDKQLLEFVASLPVTLKSVNSFDKTLLRKAFKPLLPEPILKRKKSGFNVPLEMDTKNYLSEYKFLNDSIYKRKIDGKYSYTGL